MLGHGLGFAGSVGLVALEVLDVPVKAVDIPGISKSCLRIEVLLS
ncbi:hypothetical protein BIW11_03870 [Tropilaelaps mercedesae]|uniref:Uncharacterized protein n=1 Tax=Tropilaelaps mercedesae TaxID=418985 RepID=A0A1V9XEJ9_9ACAR|nr:hypothetical protein BIW11_03870 [Tropilaelaps mercedesae]